MYSKRSELIKPQTEMRLLQHGLDLKIEVSPTLSTELNRQRTCPFNRYSDHKIVSTESTPGFTTHDQKNIKKILSAYLFSIGIKGLSKVIWLPLYKTYDKKGGNLYTTENICNHQSLELVGFVYVSKDKVKKEENAKYVIRHVKKVEIERLKDSVAHYTAWSNDDIYGVTVTDAQGQDFTLPFGPMTYHGIYNINDMVDSVVDKMT
ncbi:MAG: hypothetical protein J6N72_07215, partial [Psychrobacter sp.]|nr:hypothetical protein [Psychrobacter sp.]